MPGGIARRDGAVRLHDRLQFRERFQRGVGTRMLVRVEHFRIAFFLRNRHRDDFSGEESGRVRLRPALLRAIRERVLILTRNAEFLCDVFGGLRHGIDAVIRLHHGIHKAPADGGVVDLRGCG